MLSCERHGEVLGIEQSARKFLNKFNELPTTTRVPNSQNVCPPASTNRIFDNQKESKTKLQRTEHFVCSYIPFAGPIVSKADLQFGQISNPYEIIAVTPWPCCGTCSKMRWLDTWGGCRETNTRNPRAHLANVKKSGRSILIRPPL